MSEVDAPHADTNLDQDSPATEAVTLPTPSRHDEEDRLLPEFVTAVRHAVEQGDIDGARELVSPLHPADIADLFELTPSHERAALAEALG